MYLGIDLGTSGVKLLLIDGDQRVTGVATGPLSVSRPQTGWSEQDPADWLKATRGAMADLARNRDLSAVRGIGLSGQMHGAVVLDDALDVIRPAILWNDSRSYEQAARLDADPDFRAISGNIVFPGFTAPKLVWMAEQEPEHFARIRTVLLPKVICALAHHRACLRDVGCRRTSWLDVGARAWSDRLLDKTGMRRDHAALIEGNEVSGQFGIAAELGLPPGIPVAGGPVAATAIGAATVIEGQGFVSLGTSGVLFAATDRYSPRPESAVHTFCHALPGRWQHMGVILSASAAMSWWSTVSGREPADLTAELGPDLRAPGRVSFLPYLSGERTPHNNARARASFHGLSARSDRAQMTQAVMEGVAFAFADSLAALREAGADPRSLLALGGGARSQYWLKAVATALDLPVQLPESGDFGAAFGAARLGLMAATGADPAAICTPPAISAEIRPDPALRDDFAAALERFRALYRG